MHEGDAQVLGLFLAGLFDADPVAEQIKERVAVLAFSRSPAARTAQTQDVAQRQRGSSGGTKRPTPGRASVR